MIETNCRIITELAEDITRAVQFENVSKEYLMGQVNILLKSVNRIKKEIRKGAFK